MSLYKKYRPNGFDSVVGNEEVVESLKKVVGKQDTHAFLFIGPSGCGKTTLGRIVAKELGAKGNDYREIDSADFRGINTIRELRKQAQYRPMEGDVRVFLLDECHKLSSDAQNALLKILEDTPKHIYFILATTDPQKLISTIRGRCSIYEVKTLQERTMIRLLRKIANSEGYHVNKKIYRQIAQDSLGQPRNAIQILEQVLQVDEEKQLEVASRSAAQQNQSIELCRALINGSGWKKVSNILNGLKDENPEQIRRHVLGYISSVLLKNDNEIAGLVLEEFIDPFYDNGWSKLIYASYSVIKNT